jgi:hypothetical protein
MPVRARLFFASGIAEEDVAVVAEEEAAPRFLESGSGFRGREKIQCQNKNTKEGEIICLERTCFQHTQGRRHQMRSIRCTLSICWIFRHKFHRMRKQIWQLCKKKT